MALKHSLHCTSDENIKFSRYHTIHQKHDVFKNAIQPDPQLKFHLTTAAWPPNCEINSWARSEPNKDTKRQTRPQSYEQPWKTLFSLYILYYATIMIINDLPSGTSLLQYSTQTQRLGLNHLTKAQSPGNKQLKDDVLQRHWHYRSGSKKRLYRRDATAVVLRKSSLHTLPQRRLPVRPWSTWLIRCPVYIADSTPVVVRHLLASCL